MASASGTPRVWHTVGRNLSNHRQRKGASILCGRLQRLLRGLWSSTGQGTCRERQQNQGTEVGDQGSDPRTGGGRGLQLQRLSATGVSGSTKSLLAGPGPPVQSVPDCSGCSPRNGERRTAQRAGTVTHSVEISHSSSSIHFSLAWFSHGSVPQPDADSLQRGRKRLSLGPRIGVRGPLTRTLRQPSLRDLGAHSALTPIGPAREKRHLRGHGGPTATSGGTLSPFGREPQKDKVRTGNDKPCSCAFATNAPQTGLDKKGNVLGQETKRINMWLCFHACWIQGFNEVNRNQWVFMFVCLF